MKNSAEDINCRVIIFLFLFSHPRVRFQTHKFRLMLFIYVIKIENTTSGNLSVDKSVITKRRLPIHNSCTNYYRSFFTLQCHTGQGASKTQIYLFFSFEIVKISCIANCNGVFIVGKQQNNLISILTLKSLRLRGQQLSTSSKW